MKNPKQDAILALFGAAHNCPSRINQDAYWEYQEIVMAPLRQAIRDAQ